jgi:hypothetical protein
MAVSFPVYVNLIKKLTVAVGLEKIPGQMSG